MDQGKDRFYNNYKEIRKYVRGKTGFLTDEDEILGLRDLLYNYRHTKIATNILKERPDLQPLFQKRLSLQESDAFINCSEETKNIIRNIALVLISKHL